MNNCAYGLYAMRITSPSPARSFFAILERGCHYRAWGRVCCGVGEDHTGGIRRRIRGARPFFERDSSDCVGQDVVRIYTLSVRFLSICSESEAHHIGYRNHHQSSCFQSRLEWHGQCEVDDHCDDEGGIAVERHRLAALREQIVRPGPRLWKEG